MDITFSTVITVLAVVGLVLQQHQISRMKKEQQEVRLSATLALENFMRKEVGLPFTTPFQMSIDVASSQRESIKRTLQGQESATGQKQDD